MAVTVPTVMDVTAWRDAPMEDWTSFSALLQPALYAAARWAANRVDPGGLTEAGAVTDPTGAALPTDGDLWRTAVILKAWSLILTGVSQVQGTETADMKTRWGTPPATLAEQFSKQADATMAMIPGAESPMSGFSVSDSTQNAVDSAAEATSLGVRSW